MKKHGKHCFLFLTFVLSFAFFPKEGSLNPLRNKHPRHAGTHKKSPFGFLRKKESQSQTQNVSPHGAYCKPRGRLILHHDPHDNEVLHSLSGKEASACCTRVCASASMNWTGRTILRGQEDVCVCKVKHQVRQEDIR
jgi:hypothetical protein